MIHIPPHCVRNRDEDGFSLSRLCAALFLFAAFGWVVIDVHTRFPVL